jgi:hypothetical protein
MRSRIARVGSYGGEHPGAPLDGEEPDRVDGRADYRQRIAWRGTAQNILGNSGATLDRHLGDQILAPSCFADGPSRFTVEEITRHLETNAWVIE